jgi:superfamily I DNA/RNA helicase
MSIATARVWSQYQTAAFNAALRGESFVLNAAPGAGKTTAIVEITKQLVAAGATSVAVVAYGSGIQAELKEKLASVTNNGVKVIGTYGLGMGTIARAITAKGLNIDVRDGKYYSIAKDLVASSEQMWRNQGIILDKKMGEYVGMLRKLIDFARLTMTNESDTLGIIKMATEYNLEVEPFLIPLIARAINLGSVEAETKGVIDFADMLHLSLKWGLRFRQYNTLIVDEMQDLSNLQRMGCAKSLKFGGQFIWAGDGRQAIMGFAAADMNSYARTKAFFKAAEYDLPICYRCDALIVAEANKVFPDQPFFAREGAAQGVVRTIVEDGKLDATKDIIALYRAGRDVAVLSRCTAPAVWRCLQLLRQRVPAQVKGKDIGADLVSYIDDIAKLDGFNYTVNFREYAEALRVMRLRKYQTFDGVDWVVVEGKERQAQRITDYFECIDLCYTEFLTPTVESLKGEIDKLFADNVRGVVLMTGHRAKGLEFDVVYIDEAQKMRIFWKGMTPDQLYQEKCVEYVMKSRAKHELVYIRTK